MDLETTLPYTNIMAGFLPKSSKLNKGIKMVVCAGLLACQTTIFYFQWENQPTGSLQHKDSMNILFLCCFFYAFFRLLR